MPLVTNYRKTRGIIERGTAASRPAAADVLQGTLYFSTDTLVLERSTGSAWEDVTVGGTSSRSLPDRVLNRAVEQAWTRETRSPSNIMQELASRFRQNGVHVFRHRRGMLFVSPIRVRAFVHEHAGVSPLVNAILEALSSSAGIGRKQLFETLTGNGASEDAEPRRLALASDLRWLINEGYVIEFNDGSLDRPRVKSKQPSSGGGLAPANAPAVDTTATTTPWQLQLTWREIKLLQ